MRQSLRVLAAMAMDLVRELRRLCSLRTAGKEVDFTASLDLARKLRDELNKRFPINENESRVSELVLEVNILERDNRTLHEIKKALQEYEAIEKQSAGYPEIAERIDSRIRSIHSLMDELSRD